MEKMRWADTGASSNRRVECYGWFEKRERWVSLIGSFLFSFFFLLFLFQTQMPEERWSRCWDIRVIISSVIRSRNEFAFSDRIAIIDPHARLNCFFVFGYQAVAIFHFVGTWESVWIVQWIVCRFAIYRFAWLILIDIRCIIDKTFPAAI